MADSNIILKIVIYIKKLIEKLPGRSSSFSTHKDCRGITTDSIIRRTVDQAVVIWNRKPRGRVVI